MRDVAGRNAAKVAALATLAQQQRLDLRVVELDVQSQPSVDRLRAEKLHRVGMADLLKPAMRPEAAV